MTLLKQRVEVNEDNMPLWSVYHEPSAVPSTLQRLLWNPLDLSCRGRHYYSRFTVKSAEARRGKLICQSAIIY